MEEQERFLQPDGAGEQEAVRFHEVQRFTQPWVWALCAIPVGFTWVALISQVFLGRPLGDRPAPDGVIWLMWGLIGVGIPALLAAVRLEVRVTDRELQVRYRPFYRRTFLRRELRSHRARTYRPLLEYGGWGLRWTPWAGTAFNVRGNRGVQLVLGNGKRLLLGSQRADELDAALGGEPAGQA